MDGLKQFLEALGPRRALLMGMVALALVGMLGMLAWRGSAPEMAFLYTDLDPSSARAITDQLKAANVPFEVTDNGSAVLAPRGRLAELRMQLAGQKMGAPMGYEVLDAEQAFGVSAERSRMNEVRAIEGELARSISTLQTVEGARVHIVMPERALFATQSRKATASVTLKTRGRLQPEAIDSIRYLVSSAVPELSPEAVSIIDQTGALLARAGEAGGLGNSEIENQQTEIGARLRTQIESLLEPIVGQGKVRAEVAVLLNRARVEEESRVFDPDRAVVARQVTVESTDQSSEADTSAAAATVGNQLPESTGQASEGSGQKSSAARKESSEDVSYENSRTDRVTQEGPGGIQRLTVAVMLDANAKRMPADEVRRLTRLVENAVGFNGERGDSVVVEVIPFTAPAPVEDIGGGLPLGLEMDHLVTLAKLLIVGLIGLAAIVLLRPRAQAQVYGGDLGPVSLPGPGMEGPTASEQLLRLGQTGALPAPSGQAALTGTTDRAVNEEIAEAQAEAGVKLSALNRVGDAVANNPAEAAALIRQWMNG